MAGARIRWASYEWRSVGHIQRRIDLLALPKVAEDETRVPSAVRDAEEGFIRDEHILGLDVAMQDGEPMHVREGGCELLACHKRIRTSRGTGGIESTGADRSWSL